MTFSSGRCLEKLFSSIKLGPLTCKNRIIRSATNDFAANRDGSVSNSQLSIYRDLAIGGTGVIITANFAVSPSDPNPNMMNTIYSGSKLGGVRQLAEQASQNSAAVICQLSHSGGGIDINSISTHDLEKISEEFGSAARNAMDCGFHGVQLHCAHGYLLSRFLDPSLNFRDDSFGRGLKGRLRFPVMCIRAIRHHCGAGFPIMIKINTDTEKAEHSQSYTHELTEILECFYEDGVVLAELSGTDFRQRPHYEHNYYIEAARLLNAETHMPFAIVGGTRSLTDMWEAFSAGAAMVSMSRPLIREPDFPNSLRLGRKSISACQGCNLCFTLPHSKGIRCICENQRR